jgi:hypothetical protein
LSEFIAARPRPLRALNCCARFGRKNLLRVAVASHAALRSRLSPISTIMVADKTALGRLSDHVVTNE